MPGKPISLDFRKDMDEILWSVEEIVAPVPDDWLQILPGPIIHFDEAYVSIWLWGNKRHWNQSIYLILFLLAMMAVQGSFLLKFSFSALALAVIRIIVGTIPL